MKSQCAHSEIGGWDCRLAWKLVDQLARSTQCDEGNKFSWVIFLTQENGRPEQTPERHPLLLLNTQMHMCAHTHKHTHVHIHIPTGMNMPTHILARPPHTMSKISKMTFIT